MKNRISLLAGALVFAAMPAAAVLPETGLYYNPDYPGPGYYIEVQGDTLEMVSFAYDKDTGKPLFYYTAGKITKAKHGISSDAQIFTPPPPRYKYDYPYQFDGPLYRFTAGPCITCMVPGWNTAEHAVEAGQVHLRMSDVNRITATFTMADGSTSSTEFWRQGFGRAGYDLGRDDHRPLPDMRGEWIFVDQSDPQAPVWRFNFTEVNKPQPVTDPSYRFYNQYHSVPSTMSFVDPEAKATLTCTRYGCGLVQNDKTLFLVKFWDIGMDSLLGYKGDYLPIDDGSSIVYRTGDLVVGTHVINPTPDAAPPPEE